ncbi:MAG: NUDIX hydrolase [Actinomycetales bacterium]|nr:MAG: NUDIX hydrolase [Actinomycetales bacterium]
MIQPIDRPLVDAFSHVHDDAWRLLHDWEAPDATQEQLRRGYLDHLRAEPTGVAKAGPAAHLTASVLVFDPSLERVLLTHHRKAGAWLQLGGHLEPRDASVYAAACREVREEAGLVGRDAVHVQPRIAQLDRHELAGAFGPCRVHLDIRFAGIAPTGADPVASEESLAVRWWPVAALPEPSAAELTKLIAACEDLLG